MFEKRRLHPIAILFNLFQLIRHSLFIIVVSVVTLQGKPLFYFILVGSGILILFLVISFLLWYRMTYQVVDDEVRIEHGIFVRKQRFISKNRIQSIDLTASVIHRLFNLVKVEIETAGSGEGAEASLRAVTRSQGEQLRKTLKLSSEPAHTSDERLVDDYPSFRTSFKRLFVAGSTSGSIGVMLTILLIGFSEVEQYIPRQFYDHTLEYLIGLSIVIIIGLVFVVLFILWLLGIAGTMIKYGHFTITKREDELFITRGLLEKKQLTIPLRRIQAVGIEESIIRQPLGYVTVIAVVAGGAGEDGGFPVLFPIMKQTEVEKFLQTMLPHYAQVPERLTPLPKRSRKFYILRSLVPVVIGAIGIMYFFPQFSWALFILLIISISLGVLRHYDGGYHIENKRLTIRFRKFIGRTTMLIDHRRVQACEIRQHKIQMKQKIATLQISIIGSLGAGTHYQLKDMREKDAVHVAQWFSYRT